ncbi:MAG: SDR family NAD(P)-dependent oxidoreductase [Alphaproteobacteria bacterium]|nr:SDR family NAD(P)-dependent oxidoreductase [Alphaproteobacteria bacterium]
MDLGLDNRVAIVTGASKGIGLAIALELAKEGASVAICARGAQALEAAAERLRAQSGRPILATAADVTDQTAVRRFF